MDTSVFDNSPCFEKRDIKTQFNTEYGWLAYINDNVIGSCVYSEREKRLISMNDIDFTLNDPDNEISPELIKIAACNFYGAYFEKWKKLTSDENPQLKLPDWLKDDLLNLLGDEYKRHNTVDVASFYCSLPIFHSESISNRIQIEFQDFKNGKTAPKTQDQILWRKYVAHDLYKKGLALHKRLYWDGIRLVKRALALGHLESLVFLTNESESLNEELSKRAPGESLEGWKRFVEIDGYFFLDDEIALDEAYDISEYTPDFYGNKNIQSTEK